MEEIGTCEKCMGQKNKGFWPEYTLVKKKTGFLPARATCANDIRILPQRYHKPYHQFISTFDKNMNEKHYDYVQLVSKRWQIR